MVLSPATRGDTHAASRFRSLRPFCPAASLGRLPVPPSVSCCREEILIEGSATPLSEEEEAFRKLSAEQLFDRGFEAFETHQYALAVKHFDRILEAFPKHKLIPDAAYNAGLIYEKGKNYALPPSASPWPRKASLLENTATCVTPAFASCIV